jgi:cyclase
VRYVVNSHWHADHTHGNQAFPDAQLIASANARRDVMQIDLPSLNRSLSITQTQLKQLRQDLRKQSDDALEKRSREQIKAREDYLQTISQLKILAPFVTLDDNLTIREGKQEARLLYLGTGHTDGDIILFLPVQKIAFVGDLFFNKALPNVADASILQWMKTLEELLQLNAEKFVPGHGPVGTKKEVEAFLRYFDELRSLVEPAVDRGDSLEQVTRELQVPEKYSSYQFQNFFPSNVQKMYSEIKALRLVPTPAEDASKTGPKQPLRQK